MSLRSKCHYVVMTRSLLRNDIMRFSVLGFRSDLRIELQAPVAKRIYIFFLIGIQVQQE